MTIDQGFSKAQFHAHHRKAGWTVLVFPYANDLICRSCMTQVLTGELEQNVLVEDMHHESLGLSSGAFKKSQLQGPTVEKQAFAVVSTFRGLAYLLSNGAVIICDHRNLAYILHLGVTGATTSKAAAQRVQGWRAYIGQFQYKRVHTPGTRNSSEDMLSRTVRMYRSTSGVVEASV